ncbi:MAG: HNH endonuclease signature motif containing protein, partial [Actinomycetes bacterium]
AAEAATLARSYPTLVASLKAGRVNSSRFFTLVRALDATVPDVAEQVLEQLLPEAEGTVSNGTLRRHAQRAVMAADPDAAARRCEVAARRDTALALHPREDAMASLVATAPAVDLVAVHAAIDAFAKALRQAGAPGQLRTLRVRALQELVLTHPAITGLEAWRRVLSGVPAVSDPDEVGGAAGLVAAEVPPVLTPAHTGLDIAALDDAGLDDRAEPPWPEEPDNLEPTTSGHEPEFDVERLRREANYWCSSQHDESWADEHPLESPLGAAFRPTSSTAGAGGQGGRPEVGPVRAGLVGAGVDDAGRVCLGLPLADIPAFGCGSAGRFSSLTMVAVPYDVLLGASEVPGELAGYGPLPAPLVRAIAGDPTGTWQRLVTDPLTGSVEDFGTTRYRPPAKLMGHVITRDWTCRAPGCGAPAVVCDVDHATPYRNGTTGGTTCAANLIPLCRRHHRCKTFTDWTVVREADGTVVWTTPTGHVYTTRPDGPTLGRPMRGREAA